MTPLPIANWNRASLQDCAMLNLLFSSMDAFDAFEFVGLKLTWYGGGQIGNWQSAIGNDARLIH